MAHSECRQPAYGQFMGAGLIGVKGLPFTDFEGWEVNAKREAIRSLSLVADLRKERLMSWIRERRGDAQVMAEYIPIEAGLPLLFSSSGATASIDSNNSRFQSQANGQQTVKRIVSFINSIKNSHAISRAVNYQAIRLVDIKSGQVVASTDAGEIGAVIPGHRRILDIVSQTRKGYISDVAAGLGESDPYASFDVGHPVFDSNGVVVGIVVLEVTLESALSLSKHTDSARGETEETLWSMRTPAF